MFNKYNVRSRQVLMYAHNEARKFQHNYVGTEHVLMGIVEEGGVASEILDDINISDKILIKKIEDFVGYGENNVQQEEIFLTPRAKKLIELSVIEAAERNETLVSPEHILLAIIKDEGGVANTILQSLDVDFDKLTQKLESENNINYNQGEIPADDRKISDNILFNGLHEEVQISTPILDKFGTDLTAFAREKKLDPVIGREKEIERVLEILCRRLKNNPCLIGEPGVGKTAIVEGVAQLIYANKVPDILRKKRIVSISMSTMVAGTKYRGEFEERFKSLIEEVTKSSNIVLFIDEIHTIVGAGGAEGAIDASNILKPALARGQLQCIGATTIDEYKKYIEKDAALERRFHPVIVSEPSKNEAIKILNGIKEKYETYHNVEITEEAIEAAVSLSSRYLPDRYLPDKAIDLIDEAGAKNRIKDSFKKSNQEVNKLENKLESLIQSKFIAIKNEEFEKAAAIREKENSLRICIDNEKRCFLNDGELQRSKVDKEDIAKVLSSWTKIPLEKLTARETEKLLNLENDLKRKVIGQDHAIEVVAKAIKRARLGFRDESRPIGSFIFLGPTGVGKTELSKVLAETIFDNNDSLIRIDMTEYMEKHSISKLIGSPPGYIGFDDGGQLTERVRRKPYSVVLFDEIEKAHPDIFNILLQILEDGVLTDSKGRKIDFKNTIIIMTSNAGTEMLKKQNVLGFTREDNNSEEYEQMKKIVLEGIKDIFRPELLNRVDEVIVFHKLNNKDMLNITELMIDVLCKRAKVNLVDLKVTKSAKDYISNQGDISMYGARHLRRIITNLIEDKISEEILKGNISIQDKIIVDFEDNQVKIVKAI